MQVLALIEGVNQPCYRYRLEAFAWSMAERGLLLEAVPLEKPLFRRVRQLLAVRRADVVILQRKLLPRWQLALLRWAAKRLVYDVDDAVFQRDSYHPKGPQSRTRRWRFAATVRAADLVLAGNELPAGEGDAIRRAPAGVRRSHLPGADVVRPGRPSSRRFATSDWPGSASAARSPRCTAPRNIWPPRRRRCRGCDCG